MTTRTKGSFRRKFLKVVLVTIVGLAAALSGLYIWFVHNSNRLLINLVNEKSQGKLKLQVSQVTFDFLSNEVKIRKAKISSTAKDQSQITYQVGFQKITLTTNSLFSAFFSNALEIRKLKLHEPVIEIFSRKKDSTDASKDNLSLGVELGKLYHSIDDAVTSLNTHSISIFNATVILNNESGKSKQRLVFSNIYFSLKKLNKHKNPGNKYLENNDILFTSSNQDITLTDGLHKLSFKKLVIERGKNIYLDSCTLIGSPTELSPSSYGISFKRLALKGVDFDALYRNDIIRADSVYCEKPSIDVNLNSSLPKANSIINKIPDPGKIISGFAGKLDLGFVGVMDGDIHLNIKSQKAASNIQFAKVNFKIEKLRINPDSANPVTINTFDMLIKGYQLYNADSSCVYSFDSVRFANNALLLNNFSVHTTSGINKIRSSRDFEIPLFELSGVDWQELIFDQNLKAGEAVLHQPIINYTRVAKAGNSKKTLLFNSGHTLDDFMNIELLKILDGKINVYWNSNNSLQLAGFNLNFSGDNLADYKHVKKKDIESLFFKNGYLKLGNITARLNNVTFKTNDEIHADDLLVDNREGGINLKINDVSIKNIYTEDQRNIVLDGLQWEHGYILINAIPQASQKAKATTIALRNLVAKQTNIKYFNGNVAADAFINEVKISTVKKNGSTPLIAEGLNISGSQLHFSNANTRLSADNFILENQAQDFSGMHFYKNGYAGTLVMNLPSLHLSADIDSLLTGKFHFKNISLGSPTIDYKTLNNIRSADHKDVSFAALKIDHLAMQEPVINVDLQRGISTSKFSLPYSRGSKIKSDGIAVSGKIVAIGSLKIKAEKASVNTGKNSIAVDEGIEASLEKINIPLYGNKAEWKALVPDLILKNSQAFSFNIKENKLILNDIAAGGLALSASTISNIHKLVNANSNAWISTSSAQYITKNSLWQINNVNYNGGKSEMALDSINYHPLLTREAAIKSNPYQMDYIDFTSGKAIFSGVHLDKIFSDNYVAVQKAIINYPSINIYRDKLPPFLSVRKKLITEQIHEIEMPLLINDIFIKEGTVSYTEKTAKTRQEGNLALTHLNGNIINLKNTQLQAKDSLTISLAGSLLDKAPFKISISESYLDPLYGFAVQLNIQPYAMEILNPLLAPLSAVRFVYGNIDKFQLSAIGNENVAHGEMKLYYHDLRIQLLKNDGLQKTNFLKKVESDLVNFFFLKNKNESGTGLIYFKRLKDYSFFNYLNKIIFSGITTNISERKNRKFRKIYRKNNIVNSATPEEKN